jgi:antitoxin (DNA-binding transcriptional repressor) of toxin-antitoxin stability system
MMHTITIEDLRRQAGDLLTHMAAADEFVVAADGGAELARISAVASRVEEGARGYWEDRIRRGDVFDRTVADAFWVDADV